MYGKGALGGPWIVGVPVPTQCVVLLSGLGKKVYYITRS